MAEPARRRWFRDPRILVVGVIALFALVVAGITLSFAVFSASSGSTASITAGNLVYDIRPPTTIVNTSGMRPGDVRHGTVTLTNTKSPGAFALGFSGIGTSALASTLLVTVTRGTPSAPHTVYSGPLADAPTLDLGRLATGASLTLDLMFSWPSAARDPTLQGQTIPLVLDWSART
jgi:hypothetical protein